MNEEIASSAKVNIQCPSCGALYRIPLTDKLLRIQCRKCGKAFYNRSQASLQPKKKRRNLTGILVVGIVLIGLLICFLVSRRPSTENWVTIDYGGLVEGGVLTHSGETVAEVIKKIPDYTPEIRGLVQPYLEPFSLLCHDVLLYTNGPDTLPLVNILAHYPVGARQPAWAAISREGRFQVYYNSKTIRVFLKGASPEDAIEEHLGEVRHAIIDVKDRHAATLDKIEVYVFRNNYAAMQISLNTIPKIYDIGNFDVSPRGRPIDLASIDDFLSQSVILEAIEVDESNDLYLYGRKAKQQTIAGRPVSLSDIAVVYRSVFHYGHNAPYISLDKNEDNRFAKVNFGGLLENTRVGHVVLEADKLFKTLSTGIDPNNHRLSRSIVRTRISGFLTEDERSLLEQQATGRSQIRYWFYPDSIGTVTDGSIGAIETNQFLADVERMDVKVSVSFATRNTISHLNRNFNTYANANKIYRELNTVGRIMALINWLNGMVFADRVCLDDFLSVILPPFKTPGTTKKMLAVSTICYPENEPPTPKNVHENTKVFYLSRLLDEYPATTSDEKFLKVAASAVSEGKNIESPRYRRLKNLAVEYKERIQANKLNIESLEDDTRRQKYSLDQYNQYSIDRYNMTVDRYNEAVTAQKVYVNTYNSIIEQLNSLAMQTRQIASIGGGIGMNPKQFKRVAWKSESPQIKKIRSIKASLRVAGKVSIASNWIRNNVSHSAPRPNALPSIEWSSSKSSNGKIQYSHTSNTGDFLNVTISTHNDDWEAELSVNKSLDAIKCAPSEGSISVTHSIIGKATARAKSGKHFVFSR